MGIAFNKLRKFIGEYFVVYPKDVGVNPKIFQGLYRWPRRRSFKDCPKSVAIQSVRDRFYFLLFGAIRAHLNEASNWSANLLIVGSINGSVGVGWRSVLRRTAILNWFLNQPWRRAYRGLIDSVGYRASTWLNPYQIMLDWFRSKYFWLQMQRQTQDFSLKIEGIEVADLIIDSYLRFKPSPEFIVSDKFVRRIIWQALCDIRQAKKYFERTKPRLYLTSYATYLEHGVPVRVALLYGVEVRCFGSLVRFGKRLTKEDPYQSQNFSKYKTDFDVLTGKSVRLEEARKLLEIRLSGGVDPATSYMRKSAYHESSEILPDRLNGAVVLFLHDFYDSPHIYPNMVFDDFWQWVCYTVETLDQLGVNYFVKPHPNQISLGDDVLNRLRTKYPKLKWLSDSISNLRLAKAGIVCGITVFGTVAHELAYLGVPSICCAQHPHYVFDFCRTAKTRDEYRGLIYSYQESLVTQDEMRNQALIFYYMHNIHASDNERNLLNVFVDFWKACNNENSVDSEIVKTFNALVRLPEFKKFVDSLGA